MSLSGSAAGLARTEYSYRKWHKVASYICSQGLRWDDSVLTIWLKLRINPLGRSPQRSIWKTSGIIVPSDVPMRERSLTPSSSGSPAMSLVQKRIMKGLCKAKKDYVGSPSAMTLPTPVFPLEPSSLSAHLEQGMHQMSEVITQMSDVVLLDQGSKGPKKSAWKTLPTAETAIPKWTEYWSNCEMSFFLSD